MRGFDLICLIKKTVCRVGGSGYVQLHSQISSRAFIQAGRSSHPSQQSLLWLVERRGRRGQGSDPTQVHQRAGRVSDTSITAILTGTKVILGNLSCPFYLVTLKQSSCYCPKHSRSWKLCCSKLLLKINTFVLKWQVCRVCNKITHFSPSLHFSGSSQDL